MAKPLLSPHARSPQVGLCPLPFPAYPRPTQNMPQLLSPLIVSAVVRGIFFYEIKFFIIKCKILAEHLEKKKVTCKPLSTHPQPLGVVWCLSF